jgi:hypothetical protein
MKKMIVIILIFFLLISAVVFPISGEFNRFKGISKTFESNIKWVRTYGGDEFDTFHCVHQTQDGGYLTSGATEITKRYFPMLMKLNSNGDEVWSWTISQISYDEVLYDIQDVYPIFCNQISDGGYIFCFGWIFIMLKHFIQLQVYLNSVKLEN